MKIRTLAILTLSVLTLSTARAQSTQSAEGTYATDKPKTSEKPRGKFSYAGFSGGMMFHTGYLYGADISLSGGTSGTSTYSRTLKGAPVGLGGVARVHFGKHLRVGAEGYVSTLNYGGKTSDSQARIGWGGILADCMWQLGRWTPYIGGTIGGGGMKNLTLRNSTPLDNTVEQDASFRTYSFMLVAPFAGVEFAMTDKIRLNLKVDWMVNLTNRQADFPTGPRIYIGVSFYRLKAQDSRRLKEQGSR